MFLILLLFALIPVSAILLCFIPDDNKARKIILNLLLLANALLFVSPFIYAFVSTYPGGNMWSENGPGAVFWFYFFLIPLCFAVQLVLLIVKIICRPKKSTV